MISQEKGVLVTGATGFIGARLVSSLVRRGYDVRALVRSQGRGDRIKALLPEVTAVIGDLGSIGQLRTGLLECGTVYHLAASLNIYDNSGLTKTTNVDGTINLLRAITDQKPVRFVFASSIEAIGPGTGVMSLDDPPNPASDYGRSKLAAEHAIKEWCRDHPQVSYTILRLGNVYASDSGVVESIAGIIKGNNWQTALLKGVLRDCSLHLVHVDDVIGTMIAAAESEKAVNQTYFVANECLAVGEIIDALKAKGTGSGSHPSQPFQRTVLALWNWYTRMKKRSDFITYLSLGGNKRKVREYDCSKTIVDLGYAASTNLASVIEDKAP